MGIPWAEIPVFVAHCLLIKVRGWGQGPPLEADGKTSLVGTVSCLVLESDSLLRMWA